MVPFAGGKVELLCGDCGEPRAWFPNSRELLYQWETAQGTSHISVLDVTGRRRPLLESSESAIYSPSVSPDGKWIALIVRTPPDLHRVALVPLHGEKAAPPAEWIYVTEAGPWINKPRWSVNGNRVYYISDRDGFVCIWARHLDPATKQPLGEPKAVVHFHDAHDSLANVYGLEMSVARDRLVFNLALGAGSIWLAPGN
jgi:dipeptidyl aminopeptidase/acylaminoacyl peptidase